MLDAALQAVPRVRRTDPGTSHEAAEMAGELAKTHQERIRALLVRNHEAQMPPLGAEQIGYILHMEPYAVRKRLAELNRDGLAIPVGERKTKTGRTERTWEPLF